MSWDKVTYHRVEVCSSKFEGLLSAIGETHVNGGVVFACFQADEPDAFDRALFADGGRWDQAFHQFLVSPSVRQALPELEISPPLDPPADFRPTVALAVEGELTHILLCGGAYERFSGGIEEARRLSRDFMEQLVQGHWLQLAAGVTHAPWTDWFCDVAWDATFVLLDRRSRRVWLLCITDTD